MSASSSGVRRLVCLVPCCGAVLGAGVEGWRGPDFLGEFGIRPSGLMGWAGSFWEGLDRFETRNLSYYCDEVGILTNKEAIFIQKETLVIKFGR